MHKDSLYFYWPLTCKTQAFTIMITARFVSKHPFFPTLFLIRRRFYDCSFFRQLSRIDHLPGHSSTCPWPSKSSLLTSTRIWTGCPNVQTASQYIPRARPPKHDSAECSLFRTSVEKVTHTYPISYGTTTDLQMSHYSYKETYMTGMMERRRTLTSQYPLSKGKPHR
jgi:hypothetical protein